MTRSTRKEEESKTLNKGNVAAVDARPFRREKDVSPSSAGYHYNHNAETYMEVGNALGRAMAELLEGQ